MTAETRDFYFSIYALRMRDTWFFRSRPIKSIVGNVVQARILNCFAFGS